MRRRLALHYIHVFKCCAVLLFYQFIHNSLFPPLGRPWARFRVPTYDLDCNLGAKGKTRVGEINYYEVLIEENETVERDSSAMTLKFLCN